MKKEDRPCPVCGDQIFGRVDKKFCSDQCRNTFNNDRYTTKNGYVQKINRVLKKNYCILGALNAKGKTKVKRSKLLQEGFDFTYFTSTYETQKKALYKLVYDQSYLALDEEYLLLIKWEGGLG